MTRRALLLAALVALPGPLRAAPDQHCMTRILADVPAEEAPEETKSKTNKVFGPVEQIKVNKKTGKMTFCGHNTYCYNSNAFEFTSPCRIKRDDSMSDANFFSFFTR